MSDIYVYGTIGEDWLGDGFTAADMRDGLEAAGGGDVTIHINSGGGDVFEATAISSLVSQYREANPAATVETIVEGLAASAASYLGLTAGRVLIAPGAMMMVHDPSGGCYGQAQDMRRMADALDAVRDSIATLYARKAGGSPEAWAERMAAETWLTAEEAVELELADEVTESGCREVCERGNGVFCAVCIKLCICNSVEYNRINLHCYVILCNNGLRRKIHNLLFK